MCRILDSSNESEQDGSTEVLKERDLSEISRNNPQFRHWLDEVGWKDTHSAFGQARSGKAMAAQSASSPVGRQDMVAAFVKKITSSKVSFFWFTNIFAVTILLTISLGHFLPQFEHDTSTLLIFAVILLGSRINYNPGTRRAKIAGVVIWVLIALLYLFWDVPS